MFATTLLVAQVSDAVASGAHAKRDGNGAQAKKKHRAKAKKKPLSAAERRRQELRNRVLKNPTLALDSSFIRRLQSSEAIVPFSIRLRKPGDTTADDILEFTWDTSSETWPLAGTQPAPAPSTSTIAGSITYEWDFSADTSGYAVLGTTETLIGGGISLTGTGFPVAVDDGTPCPKPIKSLDVTGVSFTSAGVRFGIVNPFSGDVAGTINLKPQVRSQATTCDPTPPASALETADPSDPPLPVAFNGKFVVSPGVTSDGYLRIGTLKVDATKMPQRTVYGYVWACTVPSGSDPCNRQRFPVRTKIRSLVADVLVGDHMPPAPPAP